MLDKFLNILFYTARTFNESEKPVDNSAETAIMVLTLLLFFPAVLVGIGLLIERRQKHA